MIILSCIFAVGLLTLCYLSYKVGKYFGKKEVDNK